MYTQCPDCGTAFKVTAEVLKQAAGKVRCGGCGNAFNALAYLSEEMPAETPAESPQPALPELTPEPPEHGETLPRSISAEQSAALLKTLDQLAGSNVRIEDTGVEWRVLDEDEASEPAADDDIANIDDEPDDLRALDELLDESPTPVDEFLTKTPEIVDSPEIFDEDANQFGSTSVDEIRFDDNTPLPDDFDLDDESSYTAAPVKPDREDVAPEPVSEEPPPEITLSDPDEWNDILGEFQDLADDVAAPVDDAAKDEPELDDQPEPVAEERPDDPLDMDTQFALQAEAMGIDLSGMHELEDIELDDETSGDEAQDDDGLDEVAMELEDAAEELAEAVEELESNDDLGDAVDDLEGADDLDDAVDDLAVAADDDDAADDIGVADDPDDAIDDLAVAADDVADDLEVADEITQYDFIEEQDEPIIQSHTIEDELAALAVDNEQQAEIEVEVEESADEDTTDQEDEHYVAPLSEEEQSVNRMIDQELMALAIEDDDGFASTIIIPEDGVEIAATEKSAADDTTGPEPQGDSDGQNGDFPDVDAESGFESIIMEGEFVRTALDNEKMAADKAAAAELNEIAKAAEAANAVETGGNRSRLIGGIAVLALLLITQVVHQSREALATIPAFNQTIGPIYRAIGQPLQPAWDVAGWVFEVSQGNTDADDGTDELTIYSRLGNKSDSPLPYPLIAVSLTDRFEETLGSHVLDPGDYLPEDVDPRKHVRPGNTFNAVMSINSPAENVTGFKLNVCYRLEGERLSCAIDDFK